MLNISYLNQKIDYFSSETHLNLRKKKKEQQLLPITSLDQGLPVIVLC